MRFATDFAAAPGSGQVVVLDTRVDDSLRREGLAREVINRVQRARKAMDLAYEARIKVSWNADGDLAQAIEEHAERIAADDGMSTGIIYRRKFPVYQPGGGEAGDPRQFDRAFEI